MKFQPSTNCAKLIEQAEGFRSQAYLCPAKKWTIGYGTTVYPTGSRVMPGDRCTPGEADVYLLHDMLSAAFAVSKYTTSNINQNQFDALTAFTYNMGSEALKDSTLLRKINANPNDPTIKDEFNKWVFGGDGSHDGIDDDGDGKVDEPGEKLKLPGLVKREAAQATLYFTKAD